MPRSPARPRDAASLVLIRCGPTGPQVLLGRRNAALAFMPGYFVFPGGRIGPEDRQDSGFVEEIPLPIVGIDKRSSNLMKPLARAALRETYEETGLMVAQALPKSSRKPEPKRQGIWRNYSVSGLAPAFGSLQLCARAITPTDEPRRFDTRFFVADGNLTHGTLRGSGELEDLGWYHLSDLTDLPMVDVSQLVLREAWLRISSAPRTQPAITLFSWQRGKRISRPALTRRPR